MKVTAWYSVTNTDKIFSTVILWCLVWICQNWNNNCLVTWPKKIVTFLCEITLIFVSLSISVFWVQGVGPICNHKGLPFLPYPTLIIFWFCYMVQEEKFSYCRFSRDGKLPFLFVSSTESKHFAMYSPVLLEHTSDTLELVLGVSKRNGNLW